MSSKKNLVLIDQMIVAIAIPRIQRELSLSASARF